MNKKKILVICQYSYYNKTRFYYKKNKNLPLILFFSSKTFEKIGYLKNYYCDEIYKLDEKRIIGLQFYINLEKNKVDLGYKNDFYKNTKNEIVKIIDLPKFNIIKNIKISYKEHLLVYKNYFILYNSMGIEIYNSKNYELINIVYIQGIIKFYKFRGDYLIGSTYNYINNNDKNQEGYLNLYKISSTYTSE